MFSWSDFLDQYHIDYVTDHTSVARGNIGVRCPFCGGDDPSFHMGISLNGKGWGCWRKAEHRGKNPRRLVQALLKCSNDEASRIVGESVFIPEDFLERVQATLKPQVLDDDQPLKVELLADFRPLDAKHLALPSAQPFIGYMLRRGFSQRQIATMHERYRLHYCVRGPYLGRIVFPVYYRGEVATWTGRTIHTRVTMRYKTLASDEEKATAEGTPLAHPITRYLLWYDDLRKADADTIYICEGPFDALKVSVLGRSRGVVATCLFTSSASVEQIELLYKLLPRFRRRFVMLDSNMVPTSLAIASGLATLDVRVAFLPRGVKDPGDLASLDQLR